MAHTLRIQTWIAAAGWFLSTCAGAQVVGSVHGSAQAARAFYHDAGSAFIQHELQRAQASPEALQAATRFSTTTSMQKLAELGVVAPDWSQRLPHDAAPTVSTVVFLVRPGNPLKVHDWSDLARRDVGVVIANPKTCNNGRYAYMAAWGSVREAGGSDAQAADFVAALYNQAKVVAKVERDAVRAFATEGVGDVLLAFEADLPVIQRAVGGAQLQVVYPSVSVAAENAVAAAGQASSGAQPELTRAWLDWLYSDAAQELAAQHYLRPRSAAVLARHADRFKPLELFSVAKYFGSVELAQQVHFADGGRFDQLYAPTHSQVAAQSSVRAAL